MSDNQGISHDLIIAGVGVVSTVIGTFLGWLLNNISQSGDLKFYSHISGMPFKNDGYGGYFGCGKLDEADWYMCFIDVDIYNENANYKTLKDLNIRFCYSKKDGFCKTPLNKKSKYEEKHESVNMINIPPKQTIPLHLSVRLNKESFDNLRRVKMIQIKYKDEKDKTKIVYITKQFRIAEED